MLTKKQQEVYDAIKEYIKLYKYAPSYRELCEITNKSLGSIQNIITILKRKGYIANIDTKKRAIFIIK